MTVFSEKRLIIGLLLRGISVNKGRGISNAFWPKNIQYFFMPPIVNGNGALWGEASRRAVNYT